MLYCPKCQHTYETGSQRFCKNDGTRLLLATAPGKGKPSGGVFSNLLGRAETSAERKETPTSIPRYSQLEPAAPDFVQSEKIEPVQVRPLEEMRTKAFEIKEAGQIKTEHEIGRADAPPPVKPLARIVRPSEIPSGTAQVGDRKANPTGRLALTWEEPRILLGQLVKGRYYIVDMLGEDEMSISYLAEDKIVGSKKAFVRVFMDEDAEDDFSTRIFAEERVSLSHINHPNIASVIDSGELPEGKPFIVSEYLEGKTIRHMLDRNGQFNALRTARIIRQTSYALSEAHQNGILHRNLKPENIFLIVNENGTEQVKLTNFGVLYDKFTEENLAYKSPEQIQGKLSNYASDIFSLAVIAYQMLTNRLPFNSSSANNLLRAQREGVAILPTNLRLDVPPAVDEILERALAFKPSDRFPKARDFGDAFYHALTSDSPWEKPAAETTKTERIEILPVPADKVEKAEKAEKIERVDEAEQEVFDLTEFANLPANAAEKGLAEPKNDLFETIEAAPEKTDARTEAKIFAKTPETEKAIASPAETIKPNEELPWEKRSPEPVKTASPNWLLFSIFTFGLIVFLGVWYYFLNRPAVPEFVPPAAQETQTAPVPETAQNLQPSVAPEIEVPPIARKVAAPPNWAYFENSKQNLRGELAKNFLGFSIYYPKDWIKSDDENNFLDISKNSAEGQTMKKVVVTRYASRGTFNADRAQFAVLKQKSDKDLSEILQRYNVISEGPTTIQNDRWKAFEVKFQGGVVRNDNGEQMLIWGRRFWIPIQRPGQKSGFVITLLATSLAADVSSVDQVAVGDEMAQILDTFEPATNN